MNASRSGYLLRGQVSGRERLIELSGGEHLVGSSRRADVFLPVAGVSRQHAMLAVTPASLIVEDLGSTNGTLINGVRIKRSGASAGDELRFGPVRLVVEAPEIEHTELAIVLSSSSSSGDGPPAPPLPAFDPENSTVLVGIEDSGLAALWMAHAEALVAHLSRRREPDLSDALAFLGAALEATGCVLVEWTDGGDAVALGAWGAIDAIVPLSEARRLIEQAERSDGVRCGNGFFELDAPVSAAVLTPPQGGLRGLMVFGDFPGRLGSGRFLRTALRLIDRIQLAARAAGGVVATSPAPELVFPPGYRPGTSPPMVALYRQLRSCLRGDLPVLIAGETGVGKERVARILHESSDRRDGPFVAVHCSAIPPELLDAELFGAEAGGHAGADTREGMFARAEGGTLFLDEVAGMAPAVQAKLLRAVQDREVRPPGQPAGSVNVRVISATTARVPQDPAETGLRLDLYYWLATCQLAVPPLRECPDDIPGLIEHFLRQLAHAAGVRIRGVTVPALRALAAHDWPGNVRELESVVRRLVYTSAHGDVIDARHIPLAPPRREPERDPVERLVDALDSLELPRIVERVEERLIRQALQRTGGNKLQACKLLGLSRNGLDKKIKRLGISVDEAARAGDDSGSEGEQS